MQVGCLALPQCIHLLQRTRSKDLDQQIPDIRAVHSHDQQVPAQLEEQGTKEWLTTHSHSKRKSQEHQEGNHIPLLPLRQPQQDQVPLQGKILPRFHYHFTLYR